MKSMKHRLVQTLAIGLAIASVGGAANAANLVTNGGFETLTNGLGQLGYNTDATGWSTNGYNFVFGGNSADTVGSNGVYGGLKLWGPGNGQANGLGASPDGGNYVGADGAFQVAPISQTLTGLVAGKSYAVNFYWGGAQQFGFTGANTEQWEVKLGSAPSQFTSVYHNTTGGFSGWFSEKFTFTAGGTTQVLSFLAHGTPDGVPPFSLLDGVSVQAAVPEASTWIMMIAGFGLVGVAARRRAQSAVAA